MRATELGFDLPTLEGRVERELDEALLWTPQAMGPGGPATGYEPETRIRGHMSIRSYSYVGLNPEACSGTRCIIDEREWDCSADADWLELGIDAEFRTLDGAVAAMATGSVAQGRPGASFESPVGYVSAELRDVYGTLQVFPDAGRTIVSSELRTSMFFKEERTEGSLSVSILMADEVMGRTEYLPLYGQWPIPQTEVAPSMAQEEVAPPVIGDEPLHPGLISRWKWSSWASSKWGESM